MEAHNAAKMEAHSVPRMEGHRAQMEAHNAAKMEAQSVSRMEPMFLPKWKPIVLAYEGHPWVP